MIKLRYGYTEYVSATVWDEQVSILHHNIKPNANFGKIDFVANCASLSEQKLISDTILYIYQQIMIIGQNCPAYSLQKGKPEIQLYLDKKRCITILYEKTKTCFRLKCEVSFLLVG